MSLSRMNTRYPMSPVMAGERRPNQTNKEWLDDSSSSSSSSIEVGSSSSSDVSSCSISATENDANFANAKKISENETIKDTRHIEVGEENPSAKINNSSKEPMRLGGEKLFESEEKVKKFIEDLHNHKDSKKTKRALLEEFICSNASDQFLNEMEKIATKEGHRLKDEKLKKWASIFASGSISQWVSFAAATEISLSTGQPWVFPIAASLFNEIVSDKMAALIRRTTFVTDDAKNLYRKQRLIARAAGDLIRSCSGLKPQEKYRTNNPAYKGQKFTAWNALMHDTDWYIEPMVQNILNRGVPFLWFTGIYLLRDYVLKNALNGASSLETLLVRIAAGAIAGGLTAVTSQLITSYNADAVEVVGHSTSYWRAKEEYLHSLSTDIKTRLNEAREIENDTDRNAITRLLLDLNGKIIRDISVAKLRGSKLTSFGGEIAASFHKHRTEDSLDPEAPGSRSQTAFNIAGKFISLICFTYLLAESQKSALGTNALTPSETLNFMTLPWVLIVSGFMWRDDAQIVPRLGVGASKGLYDSTIGRKKYNKEYEERTASQLTEVVTDIPKFSPDQDRGRTHRASGDDYSKDQQQADHSPTQNDSQEDNNIPPRNDKHQIKKESGQTTESSTGTQGKKGNAVSKTNIEDETDDENGVEPNNAGSSSDKETSASASPSGGSSNDDSSEGSEGDEEST